MFMQQLWRRVGAVFAAGFLALMAMGAHAAPAPVVTTQLGFLWDESGSITAQEFQLMRTGYIAAIDALPDNGSVEISIVTFAAAPTVVVPRIVLTAASKPNIKNLIIGNSQSGGGTNMADAISSITSLMLGSIHFPTVQRSIINIATDGEPTINVAATTVRALQARNAGIDALTAEFIGPLGAGSEFLRDIVFNPNTGPCDNCGTVLTNNNQLTDPMTGNPWVLQVDTFDDFSAAMVRKVAVVTGNVPEPSALALAGLALAALALSRRRSVAA